MEMNRWQTNIRGAGGIREKTWSDTENSRRLQESVPERKLLWEHGWSPPAGFLQFWGASSFAVFRVPSPQGKWDCKAGPLFYRCKHTHAPTNQPPFQNRKISYPQAMNLSQHFSARKGLGQHLGLACDSSGPGGLCFNIISFLFLWSRDLGQETERELRGLGTPSMMQRAGTQGYTPLTSFGSEVDQRTPVRRKSWLLPVSKFIPCFNLSPWTPRCRKQGQFLELNPQQRARDWPHVWETSAQLTDAISLCPRWPSLGRQHISDRMPFLSHDATLGKKKSVQDPKPGSGFCH